MRLVIKTGKEVICFHAKALKKVNAKYLLSFKSGK